MLAFIWLVFFITLARTTVDKAAAKVKEILTGEKEAEYHEEATGIRTGSLYPGSIQSNKAVKIYSAQIDPPGLDAGNESVTLINIAPQPVLLTQWGLLDSRQKLFEIPTTIIPPHSMSLIPLPAFSIQLSNSEGSIKLVDAEGEQIDEVTYDKSQIDAQGVVNWWQ